MAESLNSYRLLAVLAHPDDESFAVGATLAKYAAEGVDVCLLTLTHGEGGKHRGIVPGDPRHPGAAAIARIREREFSEAAEILGLRDVALLDYRDGALDRADARDVVGRIAAHIRAMRPDVVLTFGPDGIYGHPDHIALSQFTTAAVAAAGDTHAVKKLYFIAWPQSIWDAHEATFKRWVSTVDREERRAPAWPDWAITTVIDAGDHWRTALRAILCHDSQFGAYAHVRDLPDAKQEALWRRQHFYRVFSTVNGGRALETDLFAGLRGGT
jgi:LmbE family N-acetylglucosaminyl deacetylase